MKVLAAIANHGHGNRPFLDRLIDAYRAMSHEVDVVVLSNIEKDLGDDVEVRVGVPSSNPWSLPFAHRTLFRERLDQYDLFIYSEDDTLIEQRHLDAFFEVSQHLRDDEIAGFLRFEQAPDGARSISSIHTHFRWMPETAFQRDGLHFASFSNEHAASFVATRDQVARAIDSGGFGVEPYEDRYDMLCTAATDIYARCGMKKVICLSRIDDFLLHHLPNKYIGRMGIPESILHEQIEALMHGGNGESPVAPLGHVAMESLVRHARWSKNWYETPRPEVLSAVASAGGSILSIGAGWGATEAALRDRGHSVHALPIDSVFEALVRNRGIDVWSVPDGPGGEAAASERFDCVLVADLLQLCESPVVFLRNCRRRLAPTGKLVLSTPNIEDFRRFTAFVQKNENVEPPTTYAQSHLQKVSLSRLRQWLRDAGFRVQSVDSIMTGKRKQYASMFLGLADGIFATEFVVTACPGE